MKATVTIGKSFDDSKQLSKTWENGDFEEFFKEEGQYLDRLCKVATEKAKAGESFTVGYTVTVEA